MLDKNKTEKFWSGAELPVIQNYFETDYKAEATSLNIKKRTRHLSNRILIVDDNPDVLETLAEMTKIMEYRPSKSKNAVGALAYLRRFHFQILLTAFEIPMINGYQLALHAKQKFHDIKVIVTMNHYSKGLADLLFQSGIVDEFLFKPFNLNVLKEKIELVELSTFFETNR